MTTATPTPEASVDKSGDRIRDMFGEISPRYDFMNHFLSGGTDYYWRWRTVRRVKPTGDAPILDVCTGTGDLAFSFWKAGKGQVPVIGTDFTHEMLVLANQKVDQRLSKDDKRERPTFLEADTMHLPFPDDQFQIVSVAFGLRNVSDTMAGLREMARVCQPGGHVAVLEFSLPENRMIRGVYQWYFRNILPKLGQLLARNNHAAYQYLPQSVSEFPQGKELAGMMEQCGMTDVTWTPMTFGVATLYVGVKHA
ncbi:MAG: bifunctional demethylmenaquinone methyltransferase/2-methoxy-6-polyprenyl-1,4-benzoquinol methylase UbiE [Planctomycetaceae bacterium]|nr:bifunctional demethylmenaquinone methyltransferase/2-methoxy-6-polyprenyl-1,4-benzoquinol methylase UbiE [Planctomycetaceae bacterium]